MRPEPIPPKKPLEQVLDSVDGDTVDLLREASLAVRFEEWQDRVSLADFRSMKRLALAEMWGREDVDFAEALKMEQATIEAWHKIPDFDQIKEALVQAFQTLREPKTFSEHVADPKNQDQVFRKMRLLAYDKNPEAQKMATRMAEVFVERVSPTRGVPGEGQRIVIVQQTQVDRMEATERQLLEVGVHLIEGERLVLPNADPEIHRGLPGKREGEG